jgi:hypothetical protein
MLLQLPTGGRLQEIDSQQLSDYLLLLLSSSLLLYFKGFADEESGTPRITSSK